MPETTARQAREGATLAKQAAAILRRALARNEPWKGVDEERFQPVKNHRDVDGDGMESAGRLADDLGSTTARYERRHDS